MMGMEKYIKCSTAQKAIHDLPAELDAEAVQRCSETIHNLPAEDVAPVRYGHWVWDENGMDWGLGAWVCSECHAKPETWWEADKKYNPYRCSGGHFCGNCGVKMDKDGNEE